MHFNAGKGFVPGIFWRPPSLWIARNIVDLGPRRGNFECLTQTLEIWEILFLGVWCYELYYIDFGLSWIILDHLGSSWIIVDHLGSSWIILDHLNKQVLVT